ncbi:MAG: alanine--glyoxylate aminotransferase family protein [Elusimicrobiota bacterium]
MYDILLLTPGPTPLPLTVRAALERPILHHRTDEFGIVFRELLAGLQDVYRTKNKVLVMTCSGTGAMESSVVNLLSPGDRALVHSTGAFGDRFAEILRAHGLEPVVLSEEWGHAADPERLRKALRSEKGLKACFFQHTDTSTGIVNDLKALSAAVREGSDALVVVDAVSGLAAEELETDAWGLDAVLSASQKGLMCPPGLAYAALSPRALKACAAAKLPRFYFDWRTMLKSIDKAETPYTPCVPVIVAQVEALRLIREEGLENVWKRTAELAAYARKELSGMGLRLFARDASDILTAAWLPEGTDGRALLRAMRTEDRICFGGGQEKLAGKIVRVAHMGAITRADLDRGLAVLRRRLAKAHA